ncbi:hypothetical protein K4H03_28725, partial [Mycobacterium tuberculosis]|nr:hypothetical protein [Mycobacterium tuberculosis]
YIIGSYQQPLTRAQLAGEIENCLAAAFAANRHFGHVKRQTVGQFETASAQFDHITRCRADKRFLQAGLRVIARRNDDGFGKG